MNSKMADTYLKSYCRGDKTKLSRHEPGDHATCKKCYDQLSYSDIIQDWYTVANIIYEDPELDTTCM